MYMQILLPNNYLKVITKKIPKNIVKLVKVCCLSLLYLKDRARSVKWEELFVCKF